MMSKEKRDRIRLFWLEEEKNRDPIDKQLDSFLGTRYSRYNNGLGNNFPKYLPKRFY